MMGCMGDTPSAAGSTPVDWTGLDWTGLDWTCGGGDSCVSGVRLRATEVSELLKRPPGEVAMSSTGSTRGGGARNLFLSVQSGALIVAGRRGIVRSPTMPCSDYP